MDNDNAFQLVDVDKDWHGLVDSGVPAVAVPTFLCPSVLLSC